MSELLQIANFPEKILMGFEALSELERKWLAILRGIPNVNREGGFSPSRLRRPVDF